MSRSQYVATLPLACCALAALIAGGGCASLWPNHDDSSAPAIRPTRSQGVLQAPDPADDTDSSDGLPLDFVGSLFSWERWSKKTKKLMGRGENKELARQLYREAEDLFGQALAADPHRKADIFELAAPKFAAAAERWPDSQLAMDALFMSGESYFFSDNYARANLEYEKLVKAFPNNRYLDQVDKRRFAIARYWLDLNHQSAEPFYYVNWFNKTRPWRDVRGHGLRVFDKIRIDDPTGKLADDATLAAANEHFISGKFYKADEYYTDLRKAYPTSEHQFQAHFLGVKAKINSYLGPAYGGTGLDEVEKLIKQTRRQFPQEAEKEREFLDRAAAEVRYRKAEQLMHLARFYDFRSEYRAAEHYYARVVREFHDTPLAMRAEERVGQIAGLPPKPAQQLPWLVALFPESDKVKPLLRATQQAQAHPEPESQIAAQPAETMQR
jgi:outer membrane protein assembly factor BamD (BamD/ComL family)